MKINLLLSLGLVLISALHAHGLVYDKNADWQEVPGENLGGLFLHGQLRKEGEKCVPNALTAEKEKDSNVLHVPYEGENRIYIYSSDENKAFILITINIQDGKKTIIIELYGWPTYDVSKKLITEYYNVCKHHGIPEDNIIDMTKEDECYRNKEQ